jgi:hypothetical protein
METIKKKPFGSSSWDNAYDKVENYLTALRIKNKRVLSKLVYQILERANTRLEQTPDGDPAIFAMQEAHKVTSEWYKKVLGIDKNKVVAPPGRAHLAVLLADVPNKWLDYFLVDGPWPDEFVKAMKDSFVAAGPDFKKSTMHHRALELNQPGRMMAETFKLAGRLPLIKFIIYWVVIILLLVLIFYITR